LDTVIISAIISASISAIISSIVSYRIANKKNIKDEEGRLNEHILVLNKISIEYPYLEDYDFCKAWRKNSNDERYLRYEVYCCIAFNLLEQLYKLYKGDKIKIENFICVKELVQMHKLWWKNPTGIFENISGYNQKFREYIETFLK